MWLYPGYMYLVTIVITPLCVLTLSSPEWVGEPVESDAQVQWFVIFVIYALSYVARICQFTAVIVMISNGSFPDFRGMVNGIGQVMASLGRFIVGEAWRAHVGSDDRDERVCVESQALLPVAVRFRVCVLCGRWGER